MYNLPPYKAADQQEVLAFMEAHPFITLVGNAPNFPVATQLPVLLEQREGRVYLQAHMMRKTDHCQAFEKQPQVLALFTSAHSYVSASWYVNKQVGSTWNYKAVHARGIMRFTDEAGLYAILIKLTERFENNPDSPSLVKHLSPKYMDTMMKAITGFEIEITEIEHVFKLSQNRDAESFQNIIEHLEKGDNAAREVAGDMKQL